MVEEMQVTAIRLPAAMFARLQVLSALETIRLGRRVTWAALVRQAIDEHLLKSGGTTTAITPSKQSAA